MTELVWDLSQLVNNSDPASIKDQLRDMVDEAEKIREKYHGRIQSLDAEGLLEFLERKDKFTLKYEGVVKYCHLMYSGDSTDEEARRLNDVARKAANRAHQTMAFIDVELGKLLEENSGLVRDPTLEKYNHFLERKLRKTPYLLSEDKEQLIIMKDRNGVDAWQNLQSDWLSTRTFRIEIEGKMKTLPYGEIVGLYQSSKREIRKRANQVVYKELGKDEILWSSALRAVCEDHLQMCEVRGYPTAMTQSLIYNDVSRQIIDTLIDTMRGNTGLYQRYLGVKADLMGLKKLANYDLVAPLPNLPEKEYSWGEARDEVWEAYMNFDREIGGWIDEMFEKRHIDSKVRKGKRSGAFCSSWLAGKSAYVLQSFNGKMGDIYTLAHELGHAVHAYLGSRAQKPSNYQISSCIAETGSIFGELLLTERLLSEAETKETRQAVLALVLDEFGMAAFQVSARVFFEQSLYDAIQQGEFLDGEKVSELWVSARDQIYGNSVDWLKVMKWEWTMKPHYYMANHRFYNYPYVFAQLFVFALYRIYKEEGKSFVPRFKRLLAAGSSKSPRELADKLGFSISKQKFWMKGLKQAEDFIHMLEETND
ncbi:MAG: M3 family oligoendopeptidase [Thermoproteota archaeon]